MGCSFWVVIVVINLFGVKGYGEMEYFLSIIKVLAVVGFIILGICITCGVGDQGYIGGKYWHNPGAFNHGLKGVTSVFISAAFSLVVLNWLHWLLVKLLTLESPYLLLLNLHFGESLFSTS